MLVQFVLGSVIRSVPYSRFLTVTGSLRFTQQVFRSTCLLQRFNDILFYGLKVHLFFAVVNIFSRKKLYKITKELLFFVT